MWDLTVALGEDQFKCHSLFLRLHSRFFDNLLGNIVRSSTDHMYVEFGDFPGGASTLRSVLRFCAQGVLELDKDSYMSMQAAANLLGMDIKVEHREDPRNLAEHCRAFFETEVQGNDVNLINVMSDFALEYERSNVDGESLVRFSSLAVNIFSRTDEEMVTLLKALVESLTWRRLAPLLSFVSRVVEDSRNGRLYHADVLTLSECFLKASSSLFVRDREDCCQTSRNIIHRVGILAEFMLQHFREGLDFPGGEAVDVRLAPANERTAVLHVLALYDFFLRQDLPEPTQRELRVMKLRFLQLVPLSACELCPVSALQLFSSSVEYAGEMVSSFLESLLRGGKVDELDVDEFFKAVEFLHSRMDSHDGLYELVRRFMSRTPRRISRRMLSRLSWTRLSRFAVLEKSLACIKELERDREEAAEEARKGKCAYCWSEYEHGEVGGENTPKKKTPVLLANFSTGGDLLNELLVRINELNVEKEEEARTGVEEAKQRSCLHCNGVFKQSVEQQVKKRKVPKVKQRTRKISGRNSAQIYISVTISEFQLKAVVVREQRNRDSEE